MPNLFPIPNPLTPAQQAANQIVAVISQTYNTRVRNFQIAYNALWNNPNATPAQVATALGNQGAAIFNASAQEATLLNSYQPSLALPTTLPAGWSCTEPGDGTLVLSPPPTPAPAPTPTPAPGT